jgi:Zn-dependent protease
MRHSQRYPVDMNRHFLWICPRPTSRGFRRLIPYWTAQLLGAFLAGANLLLFYRAIDLFQKH